MSRAPMIARAVAVAQRIKRPAAYQSFQYSLVYRTFFHSLGKIENRSERPRLACLHDRGDAIEPDAFDRRETITNRTLQRRESDVALVNVRRQKDDSLPSHLFRVAKNFRRVVNFI